MSARGRVRQERDPRELVLDAARAWAKARTAERALTAQLRAARCGSTEPVPCWSRDTTKAWANPKAALPESYCDECVASTTRARERHAARQRAARCLRRLLDAATVLEGSFWASAEPVTGPKRRRSRARRARRMSAPIAAPSGPGLFDGEGER